MTFFVTELPRSRLSTGLQRAGARERHHAGVMRLPEEGTPVGTWRDLAAGQAGVVTWAQVVTSTGDR